MLNYIKRSALVIFVVAWIGLILPSLISAPSDIAIVIGVIGTIIAIPAIHWAWKN